ncbi:MAG: zinc ABC transporter substrate-binding protein [Anaerolineales bacterium]|nr:zinc ABC transporter substrate-binding protein [Anaerolineales bacterium]
MKKIFNSIFVMMTLPALFLTGCGSAPKSSDGALRVLTSTTFLADIAQNVAGDRVRVDSLLPIGMDPHAYQGAPADVARIAESNLLILNGLDYELFIVPLLDAARAGGEGLVIEATAGLNPRSAERNANGAESGKGAEQEARDPHMWLDPNLVITYVENIRAGLIDADPDGAATYKANADTYMVELKDLDAWIVEQVNTIPAERRLLVTNHDTLGYFAARYGFEIVDTIIASLSSEAGTSAQDLAAVIDGIKASGTPAIFLGEVENADLAHQIAEETGVIVVDDLYFESLTEDTPAATYIDMMKHNVTRIVDGLK